MKPKYHWGSLMWGYIHTICIINQDLPINVIMQISKNTLLLLKTIKLPCDSCQKEFDNELNILFYKINESLWDNMSLFYWSVDFHNKINKKLNKSIITYEDAKCLWYKV